MNHTGRVDVMQMWRMVNMRSAYCSIFDSGMTKRQKQV